MSVKGLGVSRKNFGRKKFFDFFRKISLEPPFPLLQIANEEEKNEHMLKNTCGLVGDLITALVTDTTMPQSADLYATGLTQLLTDEKNSLQNLLLEARMNKNKEVNNLAKWALREMKNMKAHIENSNKGQNAAQIMYGNR